MILSYTLRFCLSVCLSVCMSVCLSVCPSVCHNCEDHFHSILYRQFTHMIFIIYTSCLCVCLSVIPSVCHNCKDHFHSILSTVHSYDRYHIHFMSVCLSVCLSVSVCLFVCHITAKISFTSMLYPHFTHMIFIIYISRQKLLSRVYFVLQMMPLFAYKCGIPLDRRDSDALFQLTSGIRKLY